MPEVKAEDEQNARKLTSDREAHPVSNQLQAGLEPDGAFSRPPATGLNRIIYSWGWLSGLLTTPAFLFPGPWSWVALVWLGLLALVAWRTSGSLGRVTLLDWPVLLLVGATLVGLSVSLDWKLSSNRAWSLVAGLTTYFSLAKGLKSWQVRRWALPVLATIAALISLGSLVAVDWGRGDLLKIPFVYDKLPHLLNRSFGSGASGEEEINPRVVAGALAMLLPGVWGLAFLTLRGGGGQNQAQSAAARTATLFSATSPALWRRVGAVGLALFVSLVFLLTQAPTAIGGVLLAATGLAVAGWVGRKFGWPILLAGGLGLLGLLALVLPPLLTTLLGSLPPPTGDPTQRIVFRLEMWLRSFDMLADQPFTGIGLNNFPVVQNHFYPTYSLGPEAHAHNLFLQTALDGGILGLAAFGAVLWGVARGCGLAWRRQRSAPGGSTVVWSIAIGTLAWLFYGLGESITLGHKPALLLWAMWGLLAVLVQDYPGKAGLSPRRLRLPASRKAGLALALVGVGGVAVLLLVGPGWERLRLNLVLVEGHRAVLQSETASAVQAGKDLENLVGLAEASRTPASNSVSPAGSPFASASAFDLAARLATARGDYARATRYLYAEVRLDSQQTVAKYIPAQWSVWKRPAEVAAPAPGPVLSLYGQWKARYSKDALAYARLAVAQVYLGGCNNASPAAQAQAEAQATLGEGLSKAEQSSGLLQYLAQTLSAGPQFGCE